MATSWPSPAEIQSLKDSVGAMASSLSSSVAVVVSPYRVCPLGAHIDHQGGPVTAFAINRGVLLAFVRSAQPKCVWLRSRQFAGDVRFSLDSVPDKVTPLKTPGSGSKTTAAGGGSEPITVGNGETAEGGEMRVPDEEREQLAEETGWGNYARGAAQALQARGFDLKYGITGIIDGSSGLHGGGISSSAAVGVALLLALEHANSLSVSPEENIELDRAIENGYLGLRNGVLDQSAILLSRQGHLAVIRCKEGTHSLAAPPWLAQGPQEPFKILLAFSGLSHALTSQPGYNMRVDECREAAAILLNAAGQEGETPLLGNVTAEEYAAHASLLEGGLARRAKHFFDESERVHRGVKAWTSGDLDTFGQLMADSGHSSIVNYECGCPPLVELREILLSTPGVLGARFSGAGFRGCCVALVRAQDAQEAAEGVRYAYARAQPVLAHALKGNPAVVICSSADGARVL